MTELKLSTAADATKPVEKVVEPVKVPVVDLPKTDGTHTAKPGEVAKVVTKG